MKSIKSYAALCLLSMGIGAAQAGTLNDVVPITKTTQSYKDSFSFSYGGKRYMAVSNVSTGKIRILEGDTFGSQDTYLQDTVFCDLPIPDAWAPQVFVSGSLAYIFYSTFHTGLNTYAATFNLASATPCSPLVNRKILTGVYDPTVWLDNGRYYLAGTACTNGSSSTCMNGGQWDSYLVWSTATSFPNYWNTAQALKDSAGNNVDKGRTDIGKLVEAPVWSYWDHPNPNNGWSTDGKRELYWSVGPSDPYLGSSCNPDVKAVRRGDIVYSGITPSIKIWGTWGGSNDLMATNNNGVVCHHLTHPDFQSTGDLRATSKITGPTGNFVVVDFKRIPNPIGW